MHFKIILLLPLFTYTLANNDIYNAVWLHPSQINLEDKNNYMAVQIIFEKCQFDASDNNKEEPITDSTTNSSNTFNDTVAETRKETDMLQNECEHLAHNYNKNLYFSNGSKISKTPDGRGVFWSICTDEYICKGVLEKSQIWLRMIKDNIGSCICNVHVLNQTKIKVLPRVEVLWISGHSLTL